MSELEVPVLIARKRDGGELTAAELSGLVSAYLAEEVDDAQMAALLMAGVIRGFSEAEAIALTEVLLASGDTVDLSGLDIGDTVTISAVDLPTGAKPTIERDFVIANISAPSGLRSEEAAEGGEAEEGEAEEA
ncbi:MAG: hypothetical protein ACLFTP_12505 [Rhodosalinus sp.]